MKLLIRILPLQNIRMYTRRVLGILSHLQCKDIDTSFVSRKAIIAEKVKIGYAVKVGRNATIGKWTYIEDFSQIENVKIGKYCSIGVHCHIGPWEHPYRKIALSPVVYRDILKLEKNYYDNTPKVAELGNDVWVGDGAIIMGGVKVGTGAVIGAGAVVTKDIPAYAIAVGVPAKVIKYRFAEEKIEFLLKSNWWDWSEEELLQKKDFFIEKDD